MGRQKKQSPATAQPLEEASNKVATVIIPDEQFPVRSASKRRSTKGVSTGEIVTIHNKENGAINRMAAEYALKLVERDPEGYELLR